MTDKEMADKIVKEMQGMGLTDKQMLKMLKMARARFEQMKAKKIKSN